MSPAPDSIHELIERFAHNADRYNLPTYNETQVRREFIDPLFEALGWDVGNRAGRAPQYQEVIHEATLRMAARGSASGGVRAPDYAFRVGPQVVYYVEAKKPSVDIHADPSPAYQLRRYAWTARLPASVLTDFQELALYDCRYRPAAGDPASQARVLYCKYTEYADRWDELSSILGREAVLRGDFDRWADATKSKRGTQAVDEAFLGEIEGWRTLLAQNIALRNPQIASVRDLNYAVQKIIDRIIFLRICEDRGIEPYGQLRDALTGHDVYARLVALFRRADDRYNSGLFHFAGTAGTEAMDTLTPALTVDDRVLKEILEDLYYPKSPYEFSVLGADILGNVYEQFLGSVIRLTPAHRAVVEQKPEVRKAGGVYYTPRYIVDYIVEHTVGALLEGATPGTASRLRILDPACGSGSFLLGAYDYLLRWHLEWYTSHETKQARKETYEGPGGEWRLTTEEKKRILLNNLYGVDIDPQAVEVTKLSLLLKVLEGETSDSLQMELFQQRALPDLGSNIKCGNSLIGSDFFQGRQSSMFDEEEWQRVNPFDWGTEFPEIMGNGGFDAVIGNPPYIRAQSLEADQKQYFAQGYRAATGTYDIYVLFVERALALLNGSGRVGYILPNKFFTTDYGEGLRRLLAQGSHVHTIVDFQDGQVFQEAGTYTCLLFLCRAPCDSPQYAALGHRYRDEGRPGLERTVSSGEIQFGPFRATSDGSPWTAASGSSADLLWHLADSHPPLSIISPHAFQGLKTSADKVYCVVAEVSDAPVWTVTSLLGETFDVEAHALRPFVKGEDVRRYHIDTSRNLYIVYPYEIRPSGEAHLSPATILSRDCPRAWAYLTRHKALLGARDKGKWKDRDDWYAYARGQNIGTFIGPKLLMPYMATEMRVAPDQSGTLFFVNITTGGYGLRFLKSNMADSYVVGLLNSRLITFCARRLTNPFRGGYFAVNKQMLERLPIRTIDFSDPADVARHDRMVALVERMLALHRELAAAEAGAPARVTLLQRQIAATDAEIDAVVYELYGLTDEEIRIVEEGTKR